MAFARRIAKITTGAGIHGRGEHEPRGESDRDSRTGDRDGAIFEGLAHDLENVALKFGKLIEKENAIVAERDFARTRHRTPADQAGVADGVMRRTIGAGADKAAAVLENACNAVNTRGLDGFVERHRRENCGDALGEHGLAGAGRPDKQDVVAASACDFESALSGLLPVDVAQVNGILCGLGKHLLGIDYHGLERLGRVHQIDGLRQSLEAEYVDSLYYSRLPCVGFGNGQRLQAKFARGERCRKCATN